MEDHWERAGRIWDDCTQMGLQTARPGPRCRGEALGPSLPSPDPSGAAYLGLWLQGEA